jgi:hypothetical protein
MIATRGTGTATRLLLNEGATAPVSGAHEVAFRYNEGLERPEFSTNTGPYVPFAFGQGVIVVPDSTDLAAYDATPLANGTPAWVASRLCSYILNKLDTTSPVDGRRVILSSDGKRWHRVFAPVPYWLIQTVYAIDAGAGDDDAVGDLANPLATWDELRCRMAQGVVGVAQVVYLLSDIDEDIVVDWSHDNQALGTAYTMIVGERFDEYSGTCDDAEAYWPPTGLIGWLDDAAVPTGAWSTSGLIGHHFRMTSGLYDGYVGVIAPEVDDAPTSAYYLPLVDVTTWTTGGYPSAGDTYVVYDVTTVTGRLEIQNRAAYVMTLDVAFDNSEAPTEDVIEVVPGGILVLELSRFIGDHSIDGGVIIAIGSRFNHTGSALYVNAGSFDNLGNWFEELGVDVAGGGQFIQDGESIFSSVAGDCPLSVRGMASCVAESWACWLPGTTGPALDLQEGSVMNWSGERAWGELDGVQPAVRVRTGGELWYSAGYTPAITGTAPEVSIGGAAYDYADLPLTNYPHGSVFLSA